MTWLIYYEHREQLHSGGKSHWFVDGRAIFDDPNLRESVLACWEKLLECKVGSWNNPRVVGIPTGGLPWAKALAQRLGWPLVSVDDLAYKYEGFTVLVDDVYTTGASLNVGGISGDPLALRRLVVVGRKNAEVKPVGVSAWAWIDLEIAE